MRELQAMEKLVETALDRQISLTDPDARAMAILATNNRLASFFREAGRTPASGASMTPPTPENIKRVVRTSEAYGYWQASPEESAAITG
jgi:hypothetical protein